MHRSRARMHHAARTDPKYSRASSRKTPVLSLRLRQTRYVTLAKKTRASSSQIRELNPRELRNSTFIPRSYFPSFLFFFSFFFFWQMSNKFSPCAIEPTVCINNYNQQIFFLVSNPQGMVAINHRTKRSFAVYFFVNFLRIKWLDKIPSLIAIT